MKAAAMYKSSLGLFFMLHQEGFGNGVVAALAPGATAQDAPYGQDGATQRPVFCDGFFAVV